MNIPAAIRRCSLVVVVALTFIGCGAHHASDSGSQSSVAISAAPATEQPTTESAQGNGGGTAISIPSLPIGGNVDGDAAEQCAHVNWLGPKPIPPDVSITLSGFGLDPQGIFRFGGTGCPTDVPRCTTSWQWTSSTEGKECLVPAIQIVDVDSEQPVSLVLGGTVLCVKQSSCKEFTALGPSQIQFTAQPGTVSTSPSGSTPATASTGGSS